MVSRHNLIVEPITSDICIDNPKSELNRCTKSRCLDLIFKLKANKQIDSILLETDLFGRHFFGFAQQIGLLVVISKWEILRINCGLKLYF
jgi:hypothetical protein